MTARPTRRAALVAIAPPVVVLTAAAVWFERHGHYTRPRLLALTAAGLVVAAVVVPALPVRFRRVVLRLAEGAGRLVALATMSVIGVALILPAWAFNRITRTRALDDGWARPDSTWRVRTDRHRPDGRRVDPRRMGAREQRPGPGRRWARVRRLAVVAAIVTAVVAVDGSLPSVEGRPTIVGLPITDYAHEDEPWFPAYAEELEGWTMVWDPFLGSRLRDYQGSYVNVRDGRRVSYQPERADLVVWYFGGSTTYGLGQRDDHTIPSEVAKLAEADGVHLRTYNFGVSSWVNWQEVILYAELLADRPAPDLVVFYDGVNEEGSANQRIRFGNPDPRQSDRQTTNEEEDALRSRSYPERHPDADDSIELQESFAAAQYGRGVEIGRALSEQYGVVVRNFWQPSLASKRPSPADDEAYERTGLARPEPGNVRAASDRIRIASGADPIDVSDALDEVTRPVYFDGGHTNELGARTVARAIYDHLRPDLERLAAG